MKMMILTLGILLAFAECKEEQAKEEQETSIYGSWQLVESYGGGIDVNSGNGWRKVENGFTFELNADNTFVSGEFRGCSTGRFRLSGNEITFIYDCGRRILSEEPAGVFSYKYVFLDESTLERTPITLVCYEGCASRFFKIDELKDN